MAEIEVRLVDVTKRFGDFVAVDAINLEVRDGEFFSLLGPSGSGKTTTLRMIGGFEEPTSGLIELNGQDVTWLPPYKRNVNTVFQNYALFPHLTVAQNVSFGLKQGWPWYLPRGERLRLEEALEIFELTPLKYSLPRDLSGGQRQRVALARALIRRPSLLLLDEPFSSLDALLRVKMRQELLKMKERFTIPVILITHDPEDVAALAETVVVYEPGRVSKIVSPPKDDYPVRERPALSSCATNLCS